MAPIMDRKEAKDVARQWLLDNPQELSKFLAGVTTFDGQDGAAALQAALK